MEQQRSEQDSSVGDALALALRCARLYSHMYTPDIRSMLRGIYVSPLR